MPLLKDNPVLSAFRQMGWTFTKAKSRNTNGEPVRAGNLGDSFLKKIALKNEKVNKKLEKINTKEENTDRVEKDISTKK